jgi:hypothetical protein
MRRLPKKREDAEAVMALSLVGLDPDGIFDESDINLHLLAWLDGVSSEDGDADYVTLRRYLVDFGFLRRASDGAIYRVRSQRIEEVLAPSARAVDPKQVFAEVAAARSERRKTFGRS